MKILQAFAEGWRLLSRNLKIVLVLYISNIVFGLACVLPVYAWIRSIAGRSVYLNNSAGAFDFTFLTDLVRNHGAALPGILSAVAAAGLVYLAVQIFFYGGTLRLFLFEKRFTWYAFLSGCRRLFPGLCGLAICFLILEGILLVLLVSALIWAGLNPFEMENDVVFVAKAKWILAVFLFVILMTSLWHVYARIFLVANTSGVFPALGRSLRFVLRNILVVTALALMIVFCTALLLYVLHLLRGLVEGATVAGIVCTLLIGQCAILARITGRLFLQSSAVGLVSPLVPGTVSTDAPSQREVS